MRTNNNSRKKKFLALCLSALMASSVAGFAACTDDDESSSSSSSSSSETTTESTQKDTGLIKNAGFETFDKKDGQNAIGTSVTGWTRSVNSESSGSALSSKAASGIIDITDEAWADLTQSYVDNAADLSDEDAEAQWENMSIKDKLAFCEAWEDRDENEDKKLSDLSFYQSLNIDSEDIPTCENPLTWHYGTDAKNADGTDKVNNNVLMLHNEYYTNSTSSSVPSYQKMGTAQKYTSSSTVTVAAGTSAKFSLWVKTSDLQSTWTDGSAQPAVNKGAYISISHSVGNKDYEPLVIKNINTETTNPRPTDENATWENNGWEKYEFVLQGSSYASTTFSIVLGLGQGGGSNRAEYVNGYAFFDDITCETISNDDYAAAATGATSVDVSGEKTFYANKTSDKKFALAFHKNFENAAMLADKTAWVNANGGVADKVAQPTTEKKNDKTFTAANGVAGADVYTGLGFDTDEDVVNVFAKPADMNGTGNAYLQKVYGEYFQTGSDFLTSIANEPVLMLLSAKGAAYTAKAPATINKNNGESLFTLKSDDNNNSYLAISFFVKTSDMLGATGAGVTVTDYNTKTSIASIDTTDIATVDINDDTKDIYDGWQQCFLFLSNESGKDITFELAFTLGSTSVVGTTKSSYESGFAAFTGFKYTTMNEEEFASAASGTYSKLISLKGQEETETGDSGFDGVATVPASDIENGFANPKNYRGVYSDSAYLGNVNGDTSVNLNKANAGLLSKDYLRIENESGNLTENDKYTEILENLGARSLTTNEEKWNAIFGDEKTGLTANQPLVIYNPADSDADTTSLPYGFIGSTQSVSEGNYATVSLRVKVSAGAKAYIYLIDTDNGSFKNTLSVSRNVTYWYDDDGNICAKDPAEKGFYTRRDVAFKLQPNGLYKVNTAWSGSTGIDENAYYANLGAYTETDAEGNLLVAKNGVSYDYNDNWRNEGNDGIAFYKGDDGKFYSDEDCKVLVKDLADVTKSSDTDETKPLAARYLAKESENLQFVVEPTGNNWATVTFYILGGANTRNFRLEVWSGARDGSFACEENSYVLFDSYSPNDVSSENFNTLIDEMIEEKSLTENVDYFKGVYSFYDDARFLRYNADLDENDVGDSYENYLSSSQTEGVAFLRYAQDGEYTVFADYSLSEKTIAADAEEDVDDSDDSDEESESDTNVWLLASSIAMAGVLVLAVISLAFRKILAKRRRNRGVKSVVKTKKSKKAKKDKDK